MGLASGGLAGGARRLEGRGRPGGMARWEDRRGAQERRAGGVGVGGRKGEALTNYDLHLCTSIVFLIKLTIIIM